MILASARKNFTSTVFSGPLRLCREDGQVLIAQDLVALAAKRQVVILIHGYRNAFDNAREAYKQIEEKIHAAQIPCDLVIGFFWPGSWADLGFWPAMWRTGHAGAELKKLLDLLELAQALVTIETHSLGARVALEALKLGGICHRLLLTAPAVDHAALSGEFKAALDRIADLVVMFSRNDPVLKWAYTLAMGFHKALGLVGPAGPSAGHIVALDLSDQIHSHTAYKSLPEVYDLWRQLSL